MKTFAVELKAWRKRLKLSQSLAAWKMGVSVDTLRNWEQEKHEPAPGFKAIIERVFFHNGK